MVDWELEKKWRITFSDDENKSQENTTILVTHGYKLHRISIITKIYNTYLLKSCLGKFEKLESEKTKEF